LHLFAKEQPDFNWDNPEVREDFLKTIKFWSDRGVDGYRIDVAHALTKNLKDGHLPERSSYDLKVMKNDGSDDLFDRDEVHEIYKSWRQVFNQYDPPRVAVAEAWVHPNRRAPYASEQGLGQAFGFDLLGQLWDHRGFKKTIDFQLKEAASFGSSTTWVFSNHDVIRHATRFGLDKESLANLPKWFRSADRESKINFELGSARAKAATMLVLALPGSTYLYQGEELGMHEPLNIPSDQMQDPQWFRAEGSISRDGCRVPLPWTSTGSSYGFGPGGAHLPQPAWFKDVNVEVENKDEGSSLNLYRLALALRKQLVTEEKLEWINHFGQRVLHFRRPNGWECFTNFGNKLVKVPAGRVILTTAKIVDGKVPANTTVWLQR
jgi:alpha-glucosidase